MRNNCWVILIFCCLLSCSKQDQDNSFNFSSEGGPWYFNNVELEGSKLVIEDGKESCSAEYWPEASVDSDELWCAEISWAYVSYQPLKQTLYVRVNRNENGEKRTLKISSTSNGKVKYYYIHQSRF